MGIDSDDESGNERGSTIGSSKVESALDKEVKVIPSS